MLKIVQNAHRVILISVLLILLVVDVLLLVIGFFSTMTDLISSNDKSAKVWGVIGLVAWVASIILGGACLEELIGLRRRSP
ncbi:MAG: hypothetical protein K0R55_2684 [Sporomusa sp.]|jgi:hypothetical protein|nr:hypothetical protein [Sporomusa sp.]